MNADSQDSKGLVFDIQRCSLHDGPGVRTTVFLKGCPLRCRWCHNPESLDYRVEIAFHRERCTGCGSCVEVCPHGCHRLEGTETSDFENVGRASPQGSPWSQKHALPLMVSGEARPTTPSTPFRSLIHVFDRTACDRCGRCVEACAFDALRQIGRACSVQEVLHEVLKDKPYYEQSGGGMTLSGGEPLTQPEFALALLAAAKTSGLHTCVETCGQVPFQTFEKAAAVTDLFLYDIKETDSVRHKEYTGAGNELIRTNLRALDAAEAQIVLRCLIIPGLNDREDHFAALAGLAGSLRNLVEINLMSYHPFADYKCSMVGREYTMEDVKVPSDEQKKRWSGALESRMPNSVQIR